MLHVLVSSRTVLKPKKCQMSVDIYFIVFLLRGFCINRIYVYLHLDLLKDVATCDLCMRK